MSQSKDAARNAVAAALGALIVAGGVVAFSATVVADRIISLQTDKAQAAAVETFSINRGGKSDALTVTTARHESMPIKTVEVVGVRDASIDRAGNILFQTEPLAHVTVVTKNVELPVKESKATKVERVPAAKPKPESRGKSEQPHGCESAFARPAPESLTRLSSRCVT